MKPSYHPRIDQQPGFAPHHNSRRERVRLAAIASAEKRVKIVRSAALRDLAQMAQDMGLYGGDTA